MNGRRARRDRLPEMTHACDKAFRRRKAKHRKLRLFHSENAMIRLLVPSRATRSRLGIKDPWRSLSSSNTSLKKGAHPDIQVGRRHQAVDLPHTAGGGVQIALLGSRSSWALYPRIAGSHAAARASCSACCRLAPRSPFGIRNPGPGASWPDHSTGRRSNRSATRRVHGSDWQRL